LRAFIQTQGFQPGLCLIEATLAHIHDGRIEAGLKVTTGRAINPHALGRGEWTTNGKQAQGMIALGIGKLFRPNLHDFRVVSLVLNKLLTNTQDFVSQFQGPAVVTVSYQSPGIGGQRPRESLAGRCCQKLQALLGPTLLEQHLSEVILGMRMTSGGGPFVPQAPSTPIFQSVCDYGATPHRINMPQPGCALKPISSLL